MEVIDTVACIMNASRQSDLQHVITEVGMWSERKRHLFSPDLIQLAYKRLAQNNWIA